MTIVTSRNLHGRISHNSGTRARINFLRTYRFGPKEKDPIIDQVHTLMDDAKADYQQIHERSGVAASTVHNWIDGKTRCPQYRTVCAVVRSLGYDFALLPITRKLEGHWAATAPKVIKQEAKP